MKNLASYLSPKRVLWILLFLESLAIILAVSLAVALDLSPKTYFAEVDQGGYMTYLSFLQLLIAGILALKIFKAVKFSPQLNKTSLFWLIVCIGLFFLALDDILGIHEQVDRWLHDLFELEKTDVTDLIDDFIVIGYILASLVYVISKWRLLKVFQRSFIFFQLGFGLAILMGVLDLISNNRLFISMVTEDEELILKSRQWLGVIEDSAKIFAEGMFIVGIYKCWQIVQNILSIDKR